MTAHKRTSEILQELIDMPDMGTITIDYVVRRLGDRAFALAILLFALPNSLPIPGIPGFSTITGIPIILIAWQMVAGRDAIWLPQKIANRKMSQANLAKLLKKAMRPLQWMERYLCPRWDWACTKRAERFIGVLFLLLAAIISLPIPGGNFLPGLAMTLIALGLVEKDGLFVTCAVGFALVSMNLMYTIIALAIKGAISAVTSLF